MQLKPLNGISDNDWDKIIARFDSKRLFHQSAWLEFLSKTQGGERILLEIKAKDNIVGYFSGFVLKKGPFKILGSPLVGWTTEFMGPIINRDLNQTDFLLALESYCHLHKIDHLELSNPILKQEVMEKHGFKCQKGATYIVELLPDERIMWENLKKKSCRYSIHKAQKNKLVVEDTDDPRITDEYYNQLIEVFAKEQLVPTYSKQRAKVLFDSLKEKDLLFSIWVKYQDKVIATGFFPHDNHFLYFWGGASFARFHYLCPNELLHWTAMVLAAKKGISYYNMGGRGSFKVKFGGELVPLRHWYKSYNPLAALGRSFYKSQFQILQKIKGFFKKKYAD